MAGFAAASSTNGCLPGAAAKPRKKAAARKDPTVKTLNKASGKARKTK